MYRKTPANLLNVAATVRNTQFLGPWNRCVLWVRGCLANCPGCIAPDWQSAMPENFRTIPSLISELVEDNLAISGITISGGEPFLQAEALTYFLLQIKQLRDLNVLIYSGYTIEKLRTNNLPFAAELLNLCDVLIDGRFVRESNKDEGLYGSENQRVHFLTGRLNEFDFAHQPRKVEFRVDRGEIFLVGVPPKRLAEAFFDVVKHTKQDIGDEQEIPLQEEMNERK